MRTGRDEALDIFRKWESEGSLLMCNLGFRVFAAAFRGRIVKLSDVELSLLSDDKHSEFAMHFKPEMTFYYEDSRRVPQESHLYECGVQIHSPHDAVTGLLAEERDYIAFTQVREVKSN